MSSTRGSEHVLLVAGTPATTATATTAFKAHGNSLRLGIDVVAGGAGLCTFALKSSYDDTTYYDCYDQDSAWSGAININTAGNYEYVVSYPFVPLQYYKLYYSCAVAAGTVAIKALSSDDPAGTTTISVGDVVADLDNVNTNTGVIAGDTTSLDAKVPALGTAVMAASSPITIATDDTMTAAANALLGTIDTDTGVIAGDTTSLDAKVPALGTAVMAASSPVTIATDDTMTAAANTLLGTIDADTSALSAGIATHDSTAVATGPQGMLEARTTLGAAVGNGDAVRGIADAYGRRVDASHNFTTSANSVTESTPLSDQYVVTSLIDNVAVTTALDSYAPSSSGTSLNGYKDGTIQLYILGGVDVGTNDETVTVKIEGTNDLQVSAATRWVDITESVLDLEPGTSSHASFTSTGATAADHLLSLGDCNLSKIRIKYTWGGAPDGGTAGAIVANIRERAL